MARKKTAIIVRRVERGWAGHFICSETCLFRRNTLLTCEDVEIVVSTVGLMANPFYQRKPAEDFMRAEERFSTIGCDRYYETRAFHADPKDKRYHDIKVDWDIEFKSPWTINEIDADDKANEMHEVVVVEIMHRLSLGERYDRREEPD